MKVPRFRIAWVMVAVAIFGLHFAVIGTDTPVFGLDGLVVACCQADRAYCHAFLNEQNVREKPAVCLGFRGRPLPSRCALYIVCCLTIPDLLRVSIVYEVDAIVRYIYEPSPHVVYRLSLEIQG